MRRSLHDFDWRDEVIRRYQRRKGKVQQRDRAMADLRSALADAFAPLFRWLKL